MEQCETCQWFCLTLWYFLYKLAQLICEYLINLLMENITMSDQMEMPKYNCHKQVHALKIKMVGIGDDGSGLITPANPNYSAFEVSKEFMDKHSPKHGGYYVVYKDGYKSFSPADAFDAGYTLDTDSPCSIERPCNNCFSGQGECTG